MNEFRSRVLANGSIMLSNLVACDGFAPDASFRVQTHVHADHMNSFETSKGIQTIIMSPATRDLLIAERDAELPRRSNIRVLTPGDAMSLDGEEVRFEYSGHMLGCVQVAVTHSDDYTVGYSSDFDWPIQSVLQVDELVVDATYGSPDFVRDYNQGEVEDRLVDLVMAAAGSRCVIMTGYRGRLQRAMELLSEEPKIPFIASPRQKNVARVYLHYGYNVRDPLRDDSGEARSLITSKERFIGFYELGEMRRVPYRENCSTIILSSYMVPREDPVKQYSETSWRIALTDHADFEGTIELIRASGANRVLTDASRAGDARCLAEAVQSRLGLQVRVAHPEKVTWG